jgi:hypothetical protein
MAFNREPLWGIQNCNWFPRSAPDWEHEDEDERQENRRVRTRLSRPVEDEIERREAKGENENND